MNKIKRADLCKLLTKVKSNQALKMAQAASVYNVNPPISSILDKSTARCSTKIKQPRQQTVVDIHVPTSYNTKNQQHPKKNASTRHLETISYITNSKNINAQIMSFG